jgi:NADH:ubiquinone oxidoreductase subunit 4 (subunit M)
MEELDVIWMAVLAGAPLVGAVLAGLAPRKWPDLGAWITLLTTTFTLSMAIAVLIQYRYDTLEQLGVLNDMEFRYKGSLDYRSLAADRQPDPAVEKSTDWLGRTAWLNRFGLEWLWGMDGVGMACSLAVAAGALSIAAVVWRPAGNPGAWRATLLCLEAALLAACSQQNLFFLGLLMALAVLLAALLCRFSGAKVEPGPLGNPAGRNRGSPATATPARRPASDRPPRSPGAGSTPPGCPAGPVPPSRRKTGTGAPPAAQPAP